MKIWLINHYAVPPQYYPLSRPSLFAKNLIKMGHEVTIIASSTVHNSDCHNLIDDGSKVKKIIDDGIPYILINCKPYKGNGKDRVINILQFASRLSGVLSRLEQPDAIVSTSFDPLSCYKGIMYAKKHGIKAVAEIADLWPETLVAYTSMTCRNPLVRILRRLEKEIYLSADSIVFTAAGEYEYIKDQGWEKAIPKEKVFYINNGIDLEAFEYNVSNYQINDKDLLNPDLFKVVYAGSIRRVNNLGGLLDVAKMVSTANVRFLIWGDGDELEVLKERALRENINNVTFKGRVQKKYVPYIVRCADLNYAHNSSSPLFRYGLSFNKIFDYLAAGKPIICDFWSQFNPVIMAGAGVSVDSGDPIEIAKQIEKFASMNQAELDKYSIAARAAAKEYDFKVLTQKLMTAIENC